MTTVAINLLTESGEIAFTMLIPENGSPIYQTFAPQPLFLRRLSAHLVELPNPKVDKRIAELIEQLDKVREIVCDHDDYEEDY